MSRILAAASLCALAAALHLAFCEWRRIEFQTTQAAGAEALVLLSWQREHHAAGNAAAWDARRDVLRAYHGDWIACWNQEPEFAICSDAAAPDENATVQAVKRSECAELRGLAVSRRAGFRSCLAERGHPEPRRPRWTRDDFGPRFEGPYVTLEALFAEDFGLSPRAGRSLGWLVGVLAPAFLCVAAIVLLAGTLRRPGAIAPGGR